MTFPMNLCESLNVLFAKHETPLVVAMFLNCIKYKRTLKIM
jgi:hypothetical protein